MKKQVFVSFDWDNDKRYKFLLEAWDANPGFEFVFSDATPNEINSDNIGRIKAGLTAKINSATHTLVIIGEEANKLHKDYELIGFRNWINYEIYKSIESGNRIAGVKLHPTNSLPEEFIGQGASIANGFHEDDIIEVLNQV